MSNRRALSTIIIAGLAALALVLAAVGVPGEASPSPAGALLIGEKLVNPGFEEGLTGWERPSWFASVADVQSEVVHSGTNAFRFMGKASGPQIQQDIAAAPGQSLAVSGWVNVPALGTSGGQVELLALNQHKGIIASYQIYTFTGTTTDWVQVSGTRVLPPGTALARLRVRFSNLNGTIYLDDFSITDTAGPPTWTPSPTSTATPTATPIPGSPTPTSTPTPTPTSVPPPAVELLVNPGFEEGLTGWVRPPWYASVADVQSEVVHSGTMAFYFHGKTSGSYVRQDVAAAAGQSITFSGWFNATYSSSGADWHHYGHTHIKLIALNSSLGKIHTFPGFDGMPIPPGGWTQISFTQVLPPGTAYVRLQFDTYGLDGTVYLDDLSLGVSGP